MGTHEFDNTIIAITADHGEMLGDYNTWAKTQPYDGSARVPLLFMGPGVRAGSVLSQPATTLDVVGTFLELAGVEKARGMTVQTLWPSLVSEKPERGVRKFVSSALPTWQMVVKQMND